QVAVNRNTSRNPLFDTMFVLQNMGIGEIDIPGLKSAPYDLENKTSKFDLTLTALEVEEGLEFAFEYCTKLFKPATIERFISFFKNILPGVLENKYQRLSDLEIISGEEKNRVLYEFNQPSAAFPKNMTVDELFEEQVEKSPGRIAVGWAEGHLAYRELNERSRKLAGLLREKGAKPGIIVGIMVERSPEMILGILGILKSGAAYMPIDPQYPEERIHFMLKDSAAAILIKKSESPRRHDGAALVLNFENLNFDIDSNFNANFEIRAANFYPSNPAYIIYTSGSTGQPKGVPITYANLSPLLHWGYRSLGITSHDRAVQNLSYFFDWSVWEIFITLTSGASLYMISGNVVMDAERYLDFIYRHAITVLHITPTHFQSLLHASPGKRLNTLEYLCIGAEKLNCDLVERSYPSLKENCRVFNMYGPTEATIMAAVLEIHKTELSSYRQLSSVPIGKTLGNNFLLILDRHMHLCPLSVPGELYIGGDGVARGYLNNPELTAKKFIDFHRSSFLIPHSIFDSNSYSNFYRTGDWVRWLPDGTVEFLGRIDHQVKIRGFRIEPGEIENRLLQHEAVKEALVIAREHKNSEKYLCAYVVPNRTYSPGDLPNTLKGFLSGRLPGYMQPAYFIPMAKMPLNPNGKVDLNALPIPAAAPAKESMAPRNDKEKKLVNIWAGVLGIDSPGIGIDDNFFELGGHSLNVTALIGRIHKELNIEVPFTEIFVNPTVKELAAYIGQKEESPYGEIPPVEKKDYYPLSPAQMRLFVLQQIESGSTAYNVHGTMKIEGPVDKEKFTAVFRHLIARHESLRTSFQVLAEEPVQRIHDEVEFEIERIFTEKKFIRPFNLSYAPLLRVGLLEEAEQKYILIVDMHHIISDGASVNVLIKDFTALYHGEKFPALHIHYKDFSEWQNCRQQKERIRQQEAFWLNEYSGEIPVLDLPVDYMRPLTKSFAGASVGFEISVEQTRALKDLALKTETTLFMVLLAIYNIFLAKITGQEDIVVGTPVVGRRHPGCTGIIGMFVNTLLLRNFPAGRKTVDQFLFELKDRTLQAFENQDYLYDDLVENVKINRDSSRNPLFDTMFSLQGPGISDISDISIRDLKIKPYEYEGNTSKFDMSLIALEKEEHFFFTIEYAAKLFKKDTPERFITYFKQVVSSVLQDTQKKITEIEIAPGHQVRQLFEVFNHPAVDYFPKTVMDLFIEQVAKTPFSIAGFHERKYITYEELNNRADVLAIIIKEI
ncbi:MAG TPA: amino acid adenylation domain-containing protein, partial [Candidatus Deferrimicrobium sp.]|nr:amino acid adenylation domain-containing protein [Candidatus Deferrimicrobium sp.]